MVSYLKKNVITDLLKYLFRPKEFQDAQDTEHNGETSLDDMMPPSESSEEEQDEEQEESEKTENIPENKTTEQS